MIMHVQRNCCDDVIMCGSFNGAATGTYPSVKCLDDSEWCLGRKRPQSSCSWPDLRYSCVISGTIACFDVAWSNLSCHSETKKSCMSTSSVEFCRMEVRKDIDCVSQRAQSAGRKPIYIIFIYSNWVSSRWQRSENLYKNRKETAIYKRINSTQKMQKHIQNKKTKIKKY